MSSTDFSEIRIVDDDKEVVDVIREIILSERQEDAFHVLNVGDLIAKHKLWLQKIPRVVPYFAVKCNPDPTIIKILAKLNGCFDCASKQEIIDVMKYGVSSQRIVYANPMKTISQISFAKKVGVNKMTADCQLELLKIKEIFPEAKTIIRIRCDSDNPDANLGLKFGCNPNDEAIKLIHATKELGLDLYGFSFHVGSPCGGLSGYERGIKICKKLIDYARSIGCNGTRLIDIGGGFQGEADYDIQEVANVINEAIKDIEPSIEIISEPGRYYVTSAVSAAAYLYGKKIVKEDGKVIRAYYVNDGTYGSFINELLQLKARHPTPLNAITSSEKYLSTLWGPTCDSFDCILKNVLLPDYNIGDWLVWKDMGAYGTSCSTNFNGFHPPTVFPFVKKKDWIVLHGELLDLSNSKMNQQLNDDREKFNREDPERRKISVDQETRKLSG